MLSLGAPRPARLPPACRSCAGWLNPEVQQKYGLEASAEAAWQAHGGGTYSFKNPLGTLEGDGSDGSNGRGGGAKKGGRRTARAEARPGWSSAREMASKLFRKNPNAYFYRLLEPGVVGIGACPWRPRCRCGDAQRTACCSCTCCRPAGAMDRRLDAGGEGDLPQGACAHRRRWQLRRRMAL